MISILVTELRRLQKMRSTKDLCKKIQQRQILLKVTQIQSHLERIYRNGREPKSRSKMETVTAASGMLCPRSGEWEIVGLVTTSAVFAEGKVMPEHYGRKVLWMLVRSG